MRPPQSIRPLYAMKSYGKNGNINSIAKLFCIETQAMRYSSNQQQQQQSGSGWQKFGWKYIAPIGLLTSVGASMYLASEKSPLKDQKPNVAKKAYKTPGPESYELDLDDEKPGYYKNSSLPMHQRMEAFVTDLQKQIIQGLEEQDPTAKFELDKWAREDGKGYGISGIVQNSEVYEKGGVNISIIHGKLSPGQIQSMRARKNTNVLEDGIDYDFNVAGISLVIHPHNPMAPTAHANYRYFEVSRHDDPTHTPVLSWFGGGADLTPSYLFEEDATHFHRTLKNACDHHEASFYPRFKQWCDKYFMNTHRGETRGVGGIFFDDLDEKDAEDLFKFVYSAGKAFVPSYVPLVAKRKDMGFTEENKRWQQLRRGRYVEFNLIHDRGTKFGLMTPGVRIESVLMSLPLTARWEYCHSPGQNSREQRLVDVLKNPREWA
ncbi:Coproporphyrinogen-III oxidase [Mycoemilia scoparia]|uniref:coproporphyrinogen oxidase n=1 Tax=Mycoemilia scoparia TaxID=417184 RepID=A0A9W8A9H8_9FUNG|nr:Coproporphyrinogen-III oxidase [Mycoemilia scoparia]